MLDFHFLNHLTDVCVMILQVLHMDRNDYYGGDSTSLNLNQVSNSNEFIEMLDVLDVLTHFLWKIFFTTHS
jgi:RAB protein geranylgeranyltransferase component A